MIYKKIVIEKKGDNVFPNWNLPHYLAKKQVNDDRKVIELQKEFTKNNQK